MIAIGDPGEEPERPVGHGESGEPAGHREVEAALRRLDDIDATPPADHVALYSDVHQALTQILRTIDAA